MEYYKKWLILCILILTSYILFRFYAKRKEIIAFKESTPAAVAAAATAATTEGMTAAAAAAETTPMNLVLSNYFIKSSFNSCYKNSALSTTQLEKVLRAGFRMVDFELGYIDGAVKITANKEYGVASNVEGTTALSFADALTSVKTIGLTTSSTSAANYNEPLFLHLRVKYNGDITKDTTTVTAYYNAIVATLTEYLGDYLYPRLKPNGNAIDLAKLNMAQILQGNRRCFVIVDITHMNSDIYTKSTLKNYVHATSGVNMGNINIAFYDDTRRAADENVNVLNTSTSTAASIMAESAVKIETTGNTVDKKTLSISLFKSRGTTNTLYPYAMVRFYGIQCMMVNYEQNDANYKKYMAIFATTTGDTTQTGFATMAKVVKGAAKDVPPADLRRDIKRGIYIGLFLLLFLFCVYYFYYFKTERMTKTTIDKVMGGGGRRGGGGGFWSRCKK